MERNITVNFFDQTGMCLGTAHSTKNVIDGIRKAARPAKLNTEKRRESIKSLEVNIIVNR